MFLTNNSSKSALEYQTKLAGMGIACDKHSVVTSTMVTAEYIKKNHPDVLFYSLGTAAFSDELAKLGVSLTTGTDVGAAAEGLVMGYDTELTYDKLVCASRLLCSGDIPYIAANPDFCCPSEFGAVPDCGSFAGMLKAATGKTPLFMGKPEPEIFKTAMELCGCTSEETLMIGDRMYTDIRGAKNAGIEAALVLSGETRGDDIFRYDYSPDYIFDDLGGLTEILIGNLKESFEE